MAHSLPLSGSALRETFDVRDLVAMTTGEKPWMTISDARVAARETFANVKGIIRVWSIVLRADDEVQLVSIGPRGGVIVEWVFGPAR